MLHNKHNRNISQPKSRQTNSQAVPSMYVTPYVAMEVHCSFKRELKIAEVAGWYNMKLFMYKVICSTKMFPLFNDHPTYILAITDIYNLQK